MKLADCWQAGLRINPELTIEVDNIGGNGGCYGFNNGTCLALSQILELGDKRSARQNVAAAIASIAVWESEILRQELLRKVTNLVIVTIANTEKIKFLHIAHDNALISLNCIAEKVKSGKSNPMLARQAELTLHNSKILQRKAEADRASTLRELTLLTGNCLPEIDESIYPFFDFDYPNEATLTNNPEIAKHQAIVEAATENYHLQKANAVPNVEVAAGMARNIRGKENSFLFEFNMEIPVFNRNQGNICRSTWESMSASLELQEVQNRLQMACTNMQDQLVRSYDSLNLLYHEALPAVTEILKAHENGCAEGKFEILDFLLAQNRHIELQMQFIDALTEFHQLKTDLHYLCGCK